MAFRVISWMRNVRTRVSRHGVPNVKPKETKELERRKIRQRAHYDAMKTKEKEELTGWEAKQGGKIVLAILLQPLFGLVFVDLYAKTKHSSVNT